MSLTPVIVSTKRPKRAGQGGGKTETFPVYLTNLEATQNYYGRTSELLHLEQATHNTEGPGLSINKKNLFVFRQQPAPDIKVTDQIVTPDGVVWTVQFVRLYSTTLQVDTEVVG